MTLPVEVPHQSVVEKQYNSILIEAGGTLTCDNPNAGLVLRCKGDCTIQGTIDQSCKAPKTNPNNNYDYPEELKCGDGGKGGNVGAQSSGTSYITRYGGAGMAARQYGGGYSGGGAGGVGYRYGGNGGAADGITVAVDAVFQGGSRSQDANDEGDPGTYGGGGGGGINKDSSWNYGPGGNGGTGPGASGQSVNTSGGTPGGGGGGGAGNIGGGVVLLYSAGELILEGAILCNGGNGGNGGEGGYGASGNRGSGGGGAGGGAIYIVHNSTISNTATLQVNGGAAGSGKESAVAGGLGSVTIKQYEKGMTK